MLVPSAASSASCANGRLRRRRVIELDEDNVRRQIRA
jgi:hypothetical protein